jgi:hypothetical protein
MEKPNAWSAISVLRRETIGFDRQSTGAMARAHRSSRCGPALGTGL